MLLNFYYSAFTEICIFEENILNLKPSFHICYIHEQIMKVSLITDMEFDMFKEKLTNINLIPHFFQNSNTL